VAVVAVAADSARHDALDATTNVTSIGGGAGAVAEPDVYYQGVGSVSRKVTAAGFYTSTGANRDLTATGRKTWMCKVLAVNYAALNATGLEIRVGSTTANYYAYRLASSGAGEAYPPKGGWIIMPIDPNVSGHRTSTTGTPNLAAVGVFGAVGNFSATSKGENLILDAVDVGIGLYLTGGDGADPDGTFDNFVTTDEGTVTTGRFGYVYTQSGILYVLGRLIIGATSASGTRTAAATVFTDTDEVLVFPTHKADVGFSGLVIDLGNATTNVSITRCQFLSKGVTSPDTRAVLEVYGTTGVGATFTSCTFANFRSFLLTSKVTLQSCVIQDTPTVTHASATITGCTITRHPTAINVAMVTTAAPNLISSTSFDNTGGTGHAMEITATGTFTLTGVTFTGYGGTAGTNSTPASGNSSAAVYNNSGGAVTLNITGGTTPSIRNGAGATTTVTASITVTFTGLVAGTEVRVFRTSDDVEVSGTESTGSTTYAAGLQAGVSYYVRILAVGYLFFQASGLSFTATQDYPVNLRVDNNYRNP
jgi:hypothetical protein